MHPLSDLFIYLLKCIVFLKKYIYKKNKTFNLHKQ